MLCDTHACCLKLLTFRMACYQAIDKEVKRDQAEFREEIRDAKFLFFCGRAGSLDCSMGNGV